MTGTLGKRLGQCLHVASLPPTLPPPPEHLAAWSEMLSGLHRGHTTQGEGRKLFPKQVCFNNKLILEKSGGLSSLLTHMNLLSGVEFLLGTPERWDYITPPLCSQDPEQCLPSSRSQSTTVTRMMASPPTAVD